MVVSDIMNKSVVSVSPDEPVTLAARLLYRYNVGSLPVCTADGKLRGMVTDRDIVLRCVAMESDPETTPIREVMSRSVITASPSDDVSRASMLMADAQIRRLPVVEDGKVVGIVALGDMAKRSTCNMEASKALSEISSNVRRD
ncbi:MAG: CBS domain-containing protein [Oscillospiraceae bacterium]